VNEQPIAQGARVGLRVRRLSICRLIISRLSICGLSVGRLRICGLSIGRRQIERCVYNERIGELRSPSIGRPCIVAAA